MLFPNRKKISKKEINLLPFISFNGQICLCDNEKKINDAAKELKKEKLIIASTVALKEIHQQIEESGNTPLVTFPI